MQESRELGWGEGLPAEGCDEGASRELQCRCEQGVVVRGLAGGMMRGLAEGMTRGLAGGMMRGFAGGMMRGLAGGDGKNAGSEEQ